MYSNTYSTPRQLNFVYRQLSLFRQGWFIASAAIFGLLLAISVIAAYFKPTSITGLTGLYSFALMVGGLIFTSQMFQELHYPNRSWAFLTLPVSTLEKLIGSWLLSGPLFILGYTAVTFLIFIISTLIAGFEVSPLAYFSSEYWDTLGSYLVFQTIFLWGAAYFRKFNFLKTVLVLIFLPMVLSLFAGLIIWLLFGSSNVQFNPGEVSVNNITSESLGLAFKFLWYAVLGPYMLLTTYFTLKEREV